MKAALRKFFGWLNAKLHIVADDAESAKYDAIDRELDYQEWYERYWKGQDYERR